MTDAAVTAPLDDAGQAGRAPAASEEVVVLDYGGQYSQLIARRVRDCGVFSELLPHDTPVAELAGRVEKAEVGEFGRSDLLVAHTGRLLQGTPPEQTCWMSHRDTVFEPPPGFAALAASTASPVAAFESRERDIY